MAIQPIDLQTMYTQMDKVAKNVAYQEKGVYLNRDVHQADQQKKIDEQHKAIEKAQKEEKSADKVKERQEDGSHGKSLAEKKGSQNTGDSDETVNQNQEVIYNWITDPNLGNHIDISG